MPGLPRYLAATALFAAHRLASNVGRFTGWMAVQSAVKAINRLWLENLSRTAYLTLRGPAPTVQPHTQKTSL